MNRTIVITGASSGIGKALAELLHQQGDTVIGVSRSIPKEIDYHYIACDLQDMDAIKKATTEIIQKWPKIDALVNCAGVGTGGALEEHELNDYRWVCYVNVFGLITFTQNLIPSLKQGERPKIFNIGSVAGEITIPYQVVYSMSKSSIARYTEGLRMELKPFNIEATTILPGDTKTSFTENRKVIINESSYKEAVTRSIDKMAKDEQQGVAPEKVAKIILRQLRRKRLPVQTVVGWDYKILVFLSRVLPKKLVERIVIMLYG